MVLQNLSLIKNDIIKLIVKDYMNEQTPSYELSDHDFSAILRDTKDASTVLRWGLEYFESNGFSTTDAPITATVVYNHTGSLINVEPSDKLNTSMSYNNFANYLRNLRNPEQILADGREWLTTNNFGAMDVPEITTILLNNARSILRDGAK